MNAPRDDAPSSPGAPGASGAPSGPGADGWTAPWARPAPPLTAPPLTAPPLTAPAMPAPAMPAPPPTSDARVPVSTAVDLDEPAPHRSDVQWTRRWVEGVPLRARLVAILVLLLVTALTLGGWLAVAQLRGILLDRVDDDLAHASQLVGRAIVTGDVGPGNGPLASSFRIYVDWATTGSGEQDGWLPGRYTSLPTDTPDLPLGTEAVGIDNAFTATSSAGPTTWRVVALFLQQNGSTIATVYLATPLTGTEDTLASLRLRLVVIVIAVAAVGAAVGWFAVRRSFRPLVEVEETAAAIAAGDLSRRVPERPATTEVGRLTRSLNGMLARIEAAFRAQEASEARTRRFAADASHELRTPLVSIRGFAELYRQGAVPPDEVPRTMRRIEDEAKRMGSLVEDLLLLARLDAQRAGRRDPVDLLVLAADAVHDARGLDADRAVTLVDMAGGAPSAAVVTGDEDRLRQVVANLVGNAVRHTPPGTPIEVAVGTLPGRAVLEVRDHGPGLTAEQATKVFERFYRIDASRRRDTGGGSGLGLSIVSAVVASHGGEVAVLPTPGGGATFRMTLPSHPVDGAGAPASTPGSASASTPGSESVSAQVSAGSTASATPPVRP